MDANDGISEWRKVESSNGNLLDLAGNSYPANTWAQPHQHLTRRRYQRRRRFFRREKSSTRPTIWRSNPMAQSGSPTRPTACGASRVKSRRETSTVSIRVRRRWRSSAATSTCPTESHSPPTRKSIYISDTGKLGKIRAFAVPADGQALEKQLFEIDVRCDGMCIDVEGNVYTTTNGGIAVFDKAGKKLGLIPVEEQPANVCFGGDNYQDALHHRTHLALQRASQDRRRQTEWRQMVGFPRAPSCEYPPRTRDFTRAPGSSAAAARCHRDPDIERAV